MIECITKDTVFTILAGHFPTATPNEENLIMAIWHEVSEATAVGHLPERNPTMEKLLTECGFE